MFPPLTGTPGEGRGEGAFDPRPDTDIGRIVYTYRQWRGENPPAWWNAAAVSEGGHGEWAYADVPGFCKSATLDEIAKHGHVLTPGRYVGAESLEDDGEDFAVKYPRMVAELEEHFAEGQRLTAMIRSQLRSVGDE